MAIKLSQIMVFLGVFLFSLMVFKTASSAIYYDWIKVDPDGSFLINEKIFPRDRNLRKVLEIQNFDVTTTDGVNSMELFTEYDCKKHTFRLLSHRAFSGSDLNGGMLYDWQSFDPRAFVGIPSGTPAEKVFKLVCGFDRKV